MGNKISIKLVCVLITVLSFTSFAEARVARDGRDRRSEQTRQSTPTTAPQIRSEWQAWSEWSACSAKGEKTRTRKCSPGPDHGGTACVGSGFEMKSCPVDGGWSDFTWGSCFPVCGTIRTQKATRKCDNPRPRYGGADCKSDELGGNVISRACKPQLCPVNGKWSDWSACSATACGTSGTQSRTCTEPKDGGLPCPTPPGDRQNCSAPACPPPTTTMRIPPPTLPVLGTWSAAPACPVMACGGPTQITRGTCSSPSGCAGAQPTNSCTPPACPPPAPRVSQAECQRLKDNYGSANSALKVSMTKLGECIQRSLTRCHATCPPLSNSNDYRTACIHQCGLTIDADKARYCPAEVSDNNTNRTSLNNASAAFGSHSNDCRTFYNIGL